MANKSSHKTDNSIQVYIKKSNRLNSALLYGEHNNMSIPLVCTYDGYRMWLMAAALYQKTGSPEFTITFDDYAKHIGIVRPRVENIRNSLKLLIHTNFLIPSSEKSKSYTIINLFSSFFINEGERYITGKLNQDYLEMLDKKMAGQFTMISLQSINNCKRSLCASRLYEICKQNAYKGNLYYKDIRILLGEVGYDKPNFEVRILDKWVEIVNNGTDISISYTVTRGEKNRIKAIEFTIAANSAKLLSEHNKAEGEDENSELLSFDKKILLSDIVNECMQQDIHLSPKDAAEIADRAYEVIPPKLVQNVTGECYDANRSKRTWRILSNIKYLAQTIKAGKPVKNTKSWLKAAIKEDYANDPL